MDSALMDLAIEAQLRGVSVSTATGDRPVTLLDIDRAIAAMEEANRPTHYVCFVHPRQERGLHTAYARELGRPIRAHSIRKTMRARKRALMRDWHPTRLTQGAYGVHRIVAARVGRDT